MSISDTGDTILSSPTWRSSLRRWHGWRQAPSSTASGILQLIDPPAQSVAEAGVVRSQRSKHWELRRSQLWSSTVESPKRALASKFGIPFHCNGNDGLNIGCGISFGEVCLFVWKSNIALKSLHSTWWKGQTLAYENWCNWTSLKRNGVKVPTLSH